MPASKIRHSIGSTCKPLCAASARPEAVSTRRLRCDTSGLSHYVTHVDDRKSLRTQRSSDSQGSLPNDGKVAHSPFMPDNVATYDVLIALAQRANKAVMFAVFAFALSFLGLFGVTSGSVIPQADGLQARHPVGPWQPTTITIYTETHTLLFEAYVDLRVRLDDNGLEGGVGPGYKLAWEEASSDALAGAKIRMIISNYVRDILDLTMYYPRGKGFFTYYTINDLQLDGTDVTLSPSLVQVVSGGRIIPAHP
ncbi:uncharacterized protein L969DRAFT_97318 [Mixia osmundae IAM 14324]|uniref:Uncharacterized protein n=1 Tax=Mixia osmundae (strain CBS 9802 / IAM 14324 / JCM 22182 / KY 12970) TaxID=764103 RepID=G7EB35_MIXOS|nr:uncharacterized protein L969DRAFT_97318 [Mixia osmundae IAM 14324]KEI36585.1 hypothetical protein L969DRAFT_97318 [Mixia osmundae IAM 14324]GAB00046.1 hypothetical protein E5Q_06748 [Mixia osmundae IAM 14324]